MPNKASRDLGFQWAHNQRVPDGGPFPPGQEMGFLRDGREDPREGSALIYKGGDPAPKHRAGEGQGGSQRTGIRREEPDEGGIQLMD